MQDRTDRGEDKNGREKQEEEKGNKCKGKGK